MLRNAWLEVCYFSCNRQQNVPKLSQDRGQCLERPRSTVDHIWAHTTTYLHYVEFNVAHFCAASECRGANT
eukprot:1551685-Amphidinium_carterae.2